MLCSLHRNNDRNGNHIMKELIDTALSIMKNFDWYWRMEDTNYKRNQAIASTKVSHFLKVLSDIKDKDIVTALRDIWTAHYEMSLPYMKNEYYDRKREALKNAEEKLKEITEVSITI